MAKPRNPRGCTRIALQQAIKLKGYSVREFSFMCDRYCREKNIDVTFSETSIIAYINCHTNLPFNKMRIVSKLLKMDYEEMDEVFTPPITRGRGEFWIGEYGSRAKDVNYYTEKL